MNALRGLLVLMLLPLLAACSSIWVGTPETTPRFALPPAALGQEVTLAQRLRFSYLGVARSMDAALEVDADNVRLAALLGGQTVLSLDWNGKKLDVRKAEWVPEAMDAAQVLSDLQFVFWPSRALQESLPAGWQIVDSAQRRELRQGTRVVISADYTGQGISASHVHLERTDFSYSLDIDSSLQ